MSADYADKKFWDARYSQGPSHVLGIFDWFPSNADKQDPILSALQEANVSKAGRLLDIGCGNSSLCERLVQAGYTRVVGVDYSEAATNMMRERERTRRALKSKEGEDGGKDEGRGGKDGVPKEKGEDDVGIVHYHCMDATNLSFSDATFDAVLDKGLLDSIMSGLDRKMLWQKLNAQKKGKEGAKGGKEGAENGGEKAGCLLPREEDWGNGGAVLREVRRVLKSGGVYLVVSYESPDRRLPLLRSAPDWTVTWSHFEAQQDWYLYRCALPSQPPPPI